MLIRKLSKNQYQLISATGVQDGSLSALQPLLSSDDLTLVLPAQYCSLKNVSYAKHEGKLLNKVIPYSLEDDFADRVDDLHFAIKTLPEKPLDSTNSAFVCALSKKLLAQELMKFDELQIHLRSCVSEICLLPCHENEWSIVFPDSRHCMIRDADGEGISCSRENLQLVLQTLVREKILPAQIRAYISAEAGVLDKQLLINALPRLDAENIQLVEQEYAPLLWQGQQNKESNSFASGLNEPVNLLNGIFAPKLPWGKWWQQWKVAALLVVAIAVMDSSVRAVEIYKLKSLNQQISAEMENIFRQAIPEGALVDPVLQLQRRLASLQGNGASGFIALMDKAAPVIMNNPDLEIQNINYSERDSEIQMTVITLDFNTAESVRSGLQALGLQAELIGSTSSTEGNRSRLRISSLL